MSFEETYGGVVSEGIKKLPEWIQLGCGEKPYNCPEKGATFAPDGKTPAEMPDFSKHTNHMSEFFVKNPEMWKKYAETATASGVTLAQCVKTGVDNPGHPHIKTVGITAGDEDSYTTFKEVFDPIIEARHPCMQGKADFKQPTNLKIDEILDTDIDPYDKYVLTTRVRTGRSVRGFKLPPVISFEDRRKLEGCVVEALLSMDGDLKGEYFPLHGSKSFPAKMGGMTEAEEEDLRSRGNLFQEPDSTLLLASGMGRHWPDGRGIFCNENKNLFVWLNEEDHLRIVSMQGDRGKPTTEGKQIKDVFARFIRACDKVQEVLKSKGYDFMHSEKLGWVLTCPSNLGTGLRAGCMVNLTKVTEYCTSLDAGAFKKLCGSMRLQARGTGGVDSASSGGIWDISNNERIGVGEVPLCNVLIKGARQMVDWEHALNTGENPEEAKAAMKAAIEKGVAC